MVWAPVPGLGRRPLCVVSGRRVTAVLTPVLARITSVARERNLPTAVPLASGEVPALTAPSWILCHDLFTLPAEGLEVVGVIPDQRLADVDAALRFTFDL